MVRKGQSVLEYVIILAAIIAAIIAGSVVIQGKVKTGLSDSAETITDATGRLRNNIGK